MANRRNSKCAKPDHESPLSEASATREQLYGFLRAGNRLAAVRLVTEITGVELAFAKEIVEHVAASMQHNELVHAELSAAIQEHRAPDSRHDEWILGSGLGARSQYIIHTRHPRFIAQVFLHNVDGASIEPDEVLSAVVPGYDPTQRVFTLEHSIGVVQRFAFLDDAAIDVEQLLRLMGELSIRLGEHFNGADRARDGGARG